MGHNRTNLLAQFSIAFLVRKIEDQFLYQFTLYLLLFEAKAHPSEQGEHKHEVLEQRVYEPIKDDSVLTDDDLYFRPEVGEFADADGCDTIDDVIDFVGADINAVVSPTVPVKMPGLLFVNLSIHS